MRGSRSTRLARARRATLIAAAALLALGAAACSSSSGKSAGANTSAPSPTVTTLSTATLLGPNKPATGTPVKVGLITDGSTCGQCSGTRYETAVAQATVPWLNQHMNGLAGHPITLDVCDSNLDPGNASDCANQMIRDNVAAVVIGSNGEIETAWNILHAAHIPVINDAATNPPLLNDASSTFILNDPNAQVINLPLAIAKDKGARKVTSIVIDLPIATDIYKSAASTIQQSGIQLKVVPVALGTADMTPQAQAIVATNPDGVVSIIGHDAFCIPALNALHAVGFTGTVQTISQCVTDSMRKAVPGNVVKGVQVAALAPIGDNADRSMQQYQAVIDTYAKSKVDTSDVVGLSVFQSLGALSLGTSDLTGAVTPASVTSALKSMKNAVLPGSGGRFFRCNGKASQFGVAICSASVLSGTLDDHGFPVSYAVEHNAPIGN
jgi:branched-chain amino acid transport system substrate-binding protein